MMKQIIVLALVFASVYAKCVCPFMCGAGYTGTYDECMCFCERSVKSVGGPPATCSFFPSGEFSSGGCGLCGGTGADELAKGVDMQTIVAEEDNDGPLFPVTHCVCYGGNCAFYSWGEKTCENWCFGMAKEFVDGKATMNFFPSGEFSTGGCTCCGKKDPCSL